MLASLEKGPKMDPYMLLKSPNLLKIMPMDPKMLLKYSRFSHDHPKVKISARGEPLEGRKYTIERQKTLENHEKTKIAGLNIEIIAAVSFGQSTA